MITVKIWAVNKKQDRCPCAKGKAPGQAGSKRQGSVEILARDHLVGFYVFGNRLVDDILRQLVVAIRVCLEPVADELLVVRRLRLTCLITFERPEARAVRRQDLVAKDDLAILIEAELELRVGDDDAARKSVRSALLVDAIV